MALLRFCAQQEPVRQCDIVCPRFAAPGWRPISRFFFQST